jgi:hypothetical protein
MWFAVGFIAALVVVAVVLNVIARELPDVKASNVWIKTIAIPGGSWVAVVKYANHEVTFEATDEEKAVAHALAKLSGKLVDQAHGALREESP